MVTESQFKDTVNSLEPNSSPDKAKFMHVESSTAKIITKLGSNYILGWINSGWWISDVSLMIYPKVQVNWITSLGKLKKRIWNLGSKLLVSFQLSPEQGPEALPHISSIKTQMCMGLYKTDWKRLAGADSEKKI